MTGTDEGTLINKTLLVTLQEYFDKLPNTAVVTNAWKEIISGRRSLIDSDSVIEYSFHYPIDTELYLEELLKKFDEIVVEDLRTIDGSLKAYFMTFLYYCIGSSERLPVRTSLFAAELYLKIILLPSDISKLYYEKNMYGIILYMLNRCAKRPNVPVEQMQTVLELTFNFTFQSESFVMLQGTANVYANIIKYRAAEGSIKQCDDLLSAYCLKSLKDLIVAKDHPQEIRAIMESLLRCLLKDVNRVKQRNLAVHITKTFIKDTILKDVEDKNKIRYLLDALFAILGSEDFECFQDCTAIINMLDEELYKEFLRRVPNYLESKKHENYYFNLMLVIYYMLINPHPGNFSKLDVLFSVCFKNMIIHLLNEKKQIQDRTIEVLDKISLIENNAIINEVAQTVNITGSLIGLQTRSIVAALVKILSDQYAGHSGRNKQILHILSRMLIVLNKVDGDLSSQALYLICKDGTPFSIKNILPDLHSLFLQLSGKTNCAARTTIIMILFKMAMHSDASSSVFLEHLYKCVTFPSTVNGVVYGPEQYSNILFSEEFDYNLFLAKCRHLIKYDHVYQIIHTFKHTEPGYSILLHSLLDYVNYKEYSVLTDYLLSNFEEISCEDAAGHLLNSYKRIVVNNGVYREPDRYKFDLLHGYLWDSLFKQVCGMTSIKTALSLIDTLNGILHIQDDEERRTRLLTIVSECAYRALKQNQICMGSVMYLTEVCISLRKAPRDEILNIFENIMSNDDSLNLLKSEHKDILIQLISFFGTMAMMNRSKIPIAVKLFKSALEVLDPVVQLTAIKMYYTLCTEMTHEFDGIIKFCFAHVTSTHTVLSRVCITILEELIHDNYILLNSKDFMRFIHRLASRSLTTYMMHILNERFLVSNKHDVGRFFMTTLVYMSGYSKFDNYPIEHNFREDLVVMRNLIDFPNDLVRFLFNSLQVKTKFNILGEMCQIFDSLVAGKCKIDKSFFTYFKYSLYTFKVMSGRMDFNYRETYYSQVCKSIDKQIFSKDPKFKALPLYGEYDVDVKQCTKSLLELLFFIQDEPRLSEHLFPVFDVVICWVDHVKSELIHYIQNEKGKDFDHSLKKLMHFYKNRKDGLENYLNNQERTL